jgi:hypothetical protein
MRRRVTVQVFDHVVVEIQRLGWEKCDPKELPKKQIVNPTKI